MTPVLLNHKFLIAPFYCALHLHCCEHVHVRPCLLRRLAESFEYARLLERAAHTPNSTTRMMLVAVWQLSCYNSQVRLGRQGTQGEGRGPRGPGNKPHSEPVFYGLRLAPLVPCASGPSLPSAPVPDCPCRAALAPAAAPPLAPA